MVPGAMSSQRSLWSRVTERLTRSLPFVTTALATSAVLTFTSADANAQKSGYTADRLVLGTNPDDGLATWRPYMSDRTRFFGDISFDYIRRPLRITPLTSDNAIRNRNTDGVISNQLNTNLSFGTELLGHFGIALTMPISLLTTANQPQQASTAQTDLSGIDPPKGGPGDLRLDLRVVHGTASRSIRGGLALSYFFPTSNPDGFVGDGEGHTLIQGMVEEKIGPGVGTLILTQNLGFHFRKPYTLGELNFEDEFTFGAGVFVPLRPVANHETIRVGFSVYGSTGLNKNTQGQSQFFKVSNTPLEWLAEGRFWLDKQQQWWAGGGGGTLFIPGYSAPDFRVVAQVGYHFGIKDTPAASPPPKLGGDWVPPPDKDPDTDGDGIPDSVDPCPTEPEDHKEPSPNDGCPGPKDRDGDGILDKDDMCPDVPEDRDGLADEDGCPEDDFDGDKIPDDKDACPKEPGVASTDPKRNGCPQFISRIEGSNEIKILKTIEFDTGKATIKPVSFPILDEVVSLMNANKDIKKVSVEGHTDNRGDYKMNTQLSKDRAAAVVKYLSSKGIDPGRLGSDGFGPDKPIDDNKTEKGRQRNRRVEFKISN